MQTNTAKIAVKGLRFVVRIKAKRTVYGRLEYLVQPQNGDGCAWVRATSIIRPGPIPNLVKTEGANTPPQPMENE